MLRIFVLLVCLCFGLGTGTALLGPRSHKSAITAISLGLALAGGVAILAGAVWFWIHPMQENGETLFVSLPSASISMPQLALQLYADRLSAFFLFLIGMFTALVSLYSLAWLRDKMEQHRIAGVFNLFVLFTLLTVLANNAYFLLVFLEGMTLSFSYLVLYRHNKSLGQPDASLEERESAKTAFKTYLIFSHVGIVCLAAAFLILSFSALNKMQGFDFDILRLSPPFTSTILASTVFLLGLVGYGIKTGMAPFHVWVPLAHPQSPTSIHAMMSGVILKVAGIYGMLRLFFEFLRPVQWWWGLLILLLAGLTAVVGVFYALLSPDLKSALASHSVENIGIILAGMGLALLFSTQAYDSTVLPSLAGLAMIACLYHTLNHSVFKGLLFFCTGAVEERTGTVAFTDLGGLMKRYPWTAVGFLVGAISITGFPPFNGFISEWLTLQSLFTGMDLFLTQQRIFMLVGLLATLFLLGSAFGLTALSFVKIFGEVFLGAARRPDIAAQAKSGDVPWRMRVVIVFLALACLFLGLLPSVVSHRLGEVAQSLHLQTDSISVEFGGGVSVSAQLELPSQNNDEQPYTTRLSERLLIFSAMIVLLPLSTAFIWQRFFARRRLPADEPVWTGGSAYFPESMQATSATFTSLAWKPFERTAVDSPGEEQDGKYIPYRMPLTRTRYVPEFFRLVYDRLVACLVSWSQKSGDAFQNGDIRRYLWYIFAAFLLVLAAALVLVRLGE